jgi:hypothetical protein
MGAKETEIDRAVWQLAEEMAQTHDAISAVHRFAEKATDPMVQLHCMKAAAHMMKAQASAALSLKRLTREDNHTFTFVHQGRPPTPKKSKTNVPAGGRSEAQDAQAVHGA